MACKFLGLRREIRDITYPTPIVKAVAILRIEGGYDYDIEGTVWLSEETRKALLHLATLIEPLHLRIDVNQSAFLIVVYPKPRPKPYEIRFVSHYAELFRSVESIRKAMSSACHLVAKDLMRVLRTNAISIGG